MIYTIDAQTGVQTVTETADIEIPSPVPTPQEPTVEERLKAAEDALLVLMGG